MLPDYRIRQRDVLLEIIRTITEELDLERVLEKILRISVEILEGEAGIIALPGGTAADSGGWRIAASVGVAPDFLKPLSAVLRELPPADDPKRRLLPQIERRLQQMIRTASLGWLSSLGLPMTARGAVVGAVYVFRAGRALFTDDERALLQAFADQAAVAVANARLFAQVREEKQRLDAILESSAEGIAILGPDDRIQRFNRAIARLAGVGPEQAVGQSHDDVLRFSSPKTGRTLSQAEAGGWPLSGRATLYLEADLLRRAGSPVSVGVTYAPVFAQDRNLLNIVVGMRDLTRFREAEEIKDTFISIISHELKTPVALIKGYASTLRRQDVQWEREVVEDSLSVIEEEADRLTALIEDLLDASRLQAGGLSPNYGEVDLPRLAARAAERLSKQFPDRTIRADFPRSFPAVSADEQRIVQVISNLVSNAVKYSAAGSPVTIRGAAAPAEVTVSVEDEGYGIPPKDLPHVFDRFYRGADSAKRTKGAGLGLYLAKAVVEAHGGRIWIDSEPGKGTRACFTLPRDRK
ncbi:MAG: PAS domain S-box protein [Anaerolineales bacterium]|nr:PAS domain S-box protein [Anaerolineales bacterium]